MKTIRLLTALRADNETTRPDGAFVPPGELRELCSFCAIKQRDIKQYGTLVEAFEKTYVDACMYKVAMMRDGGWDGSVQANGADDRKFCECRRDQFKKRGCAVKEYKNTLPYRAFSAFNEEIEGGAKMCNDFYMKNDVNLQEAGCLEIPKREADPYAFECPKMDQVDLYCGTIPELLEGD